MSLNENLQGMNHEERRKRRKEMAEECRTRLTADKLGNRLVEGEVAKSYGVSLSTIIKACMEHGIVTSRKMSVAMPSSFLILKLLIDGEKPAELAKKFDVSRQCVDQVKQRGIDAGFPLKNRN